MGNRRRDKQGAEPVRDEVRPSFPARFGTASTELYCTECSEWYTVRNRSAHDH